VTRALQLHPTVPGLYVLAASLETSASGARTLFQRGLRMNGESQELWEAYAGMEESFAEHMRRRWSVLGVEGSGESREVLEGGIVSLVRGMTQKGN
jgi:U3 small nucleolar RNA-associated protein 6